VQKARPDAAVEPHTAGDLLNVCIGDLAQVGDSVDEGNLEREKALEACLMISADLVDVLSRGGGCAVELAPEIASGHW
jgi:hypothetical protein